MIRVREVRLIDENGQNVRGWCRTAQATGASGRSWPRSGRGLADADPPVAKILDFGKFKYQEQKKAAEAQEAEGRRNQRDQMRPSIDDHDYDVKLRAIRRFLREGDKVKVSPCASAAARWLTSSWAGSPAARQDRD